MQQEFGMGARGQTERLRLSRGDGEDTSLQRVSVCWYAEKWAHCVKPGGTAGLYWIPVPALWLGWDFFI